MLHCAENCRTEFLRTTRNLLRENLEFVLKKLEHSGEKIQDTVLLFHKAGTAVVPKNDQGFSCIEMEVDMEPGSNFVSIDGIPSLMPPIRSEAKCKYNGEPLENY
jgi:hypothetical protein